MMVKRIAGSAIAAVMLAAALGTAVPASLRDVNAAETTPDYAEALQKSLYFYECQQAGPLPDWNRVEWRADSTMIDEVPGGWYDAGDHVKFNLPMSYSASMLAWGLYQYPDGVEAAGEMENYVNNLTFVLDYMEACDRGTEVVFQVGNGQKDHTWWGPVELYEYGMADQGNSYEEARELFAASDGCAAVFGGMAAALASGYCALEGRVDQAKLDGYLAAAENIFALADASRSDDVYNASDASGFYRSSHFYDQLFYAANWLYLATDNQDYLDKATSYIPSLETELGSDELKYTWGMCWDDVMQGGMVLYAINTQDSFYISRVEKAVNYWTNDVKQLDGGMRWLFTWGSLRHATAAAFTAAVACDTVLKDTKTQANVDFYEAQANYALGVNPNNQSFLVGYGENSPQNPHHRTAHASWNNALDNPTNNRHVLYGALVGGPTENGEYEDDRQNFINNEVATDYNAGFTALLCKMLDSYGGTSDPNFPQPEAHDGPELFVEAKHKSSASGVDLSLKFTNHTAWPARIVDNVSYRYYMDLTEIIDAGYSASDVVIRCDRDQAAMYSGEGVAPVEISSPIQYDGNIYYIEVTYPDGRAAMPISEGRHQCELMLALVFPNYGSGWDAANDYSNTDLLDSEDAVVSDKIPVYVDGVLYYGTEPDGTSADGGTMPTEQETEPSSETEENTTEENSSGSDSILYGDVDLSGKVDIMDVIALSQATMGMFELTTEQSLRADCSLDGSITGGDTLLIMQFLVKLIDALGV